MSTSEKLERSFGTPAFPCASCRSELDRPGQLALENIEVVQRHVAESLHRHSEIERQDLRLGMGDPLGQQQGVELRRLAVVEADDELATVLADALQRMRQTGREVPEATLAHVLDVGAAVLIDGGDTADALGHEGPFGEHVPVHLADAAARQAHVDAGDRLGDLEIFLGHLACPTAVLDAARGVVERGPEHRQGTNVSRGRRNGAGKLSREGGVVGADDRRARGIVERIDRTLRRLVGIAERGGLRRSRGSHQSAGRRHHEDFATR